MNEYNQSENREIWEYELALDKHETKELVAHLWEVETNSHFDYFFLDENCAYQLLTMLEAVKPEWDLTHWTMGEVPSESIKKVVSVAGAVRAVRYRPSLRQQVFQKYSILSSGERKRFESILSQKRFGKEIGIENSFVLEALGIYLSFEKKQQGKLGKSDDELFRKTLLARSQLPATTADVVTSESKTEHSHTTRPDVGHKSKRLGYSAGTENSGGSHKFFSEVGFKFAYHNLLNNNQGYVHFLKWISRNTTAPLP